MSSSNFEDFLSEKTELDPEVIAELFKNYQDKFRVAKVLIDRYGLQKEALGRLYGDFIGFAYVEPTKSIIKKAYIDQLGKKFLSDNNVLPLYKFGKAITVCASDPKNPYLQDKLEKILGEIVSFVFCFPSDIEDYLNNI